METQMLLYLKQAQAAMHNAYTPYSHFRVGACLVCEDGSVYTGCNIENASYTPTNCAERTAFVKAISEGERKFEAIAIYGSGSEAVPCGICRQFMFEFAPQIIVITADDPQQLHIRPLNVLLPEGFRLEGGNA